jgi:AcrR family transcriptional regulator
MAPRTRDQFSEMRDNARARIMNAALELLAAEGYHSASVSKIAESAGVSKGLLYNYFESKEQLLKEIIFSGINRITFGLDADHDGILTKKEIVSFIRDSFKMVKGNPDYWKLYFLVMYQSPALKLFQKELLDVLGNYLSMIERYFRDQKADNPALEARLFSSLLDGVCINFLHDPENFPIDEIEDRIVTMYS